MIKMATCTDKEQEEKIDLEEEVEAKEQTEEITEEVGEGDQVEPGDDEDDNAGETQDAAGEKDEEKKKAAPAMPQQVVKAKKKQDDVLNLNNEVVMMRKDVKRIRVIIIRKLISQIAALKKKKGKEMEVEKNQRRAARLLEEIHAMKILAPDLVTKTALQKSVNFDRVCKNPKSTISDRAIARIATHPQFNKKIEQIKAAVKAFKEERMKGGKQGCKVQVQAQADKSQLQSKGSDGKGEQTNKEGGEDTEKESIDKPPPEDKGNANMPADTDDVEEKQTPEIKSIKPASLKKCDVIRTGRNKPQSVAVEPQPTSKSVSELIQKKETEAESGLESSEEEEDDKEEKEYFDDSTEERFHKQSSGSESDDDDDFFLGKVSKFKKKKKKTSGEVVKQVQEGKGDTTGPVKTSDPIQAELDDLESRLKSKTTSLKSVFCSSLSGMKQSRGGGGGRGGNTFSKQRDGNRDFSKQTKFQNQEKGKEGLKHSKPCPGSEERGFASTGRGRGRGRGRGDFKRENDRRGGGFISHQAPQQALHPSWEASKKRKEQQGQIQAFQGKKIKFDDDD